MFREISHVFLCCLLALMSDSQELPCLGWFMPGTHDCKPQVVRKHSEQSEEQSSTPDLPPKGFLAKVENRRPGTVNAAIEANFPKQRQEREVFGNTEQTSKTPLKPPAQKEWPGQ